MPHSGDPSATQLAQLSSASLSDALAQRSGHRWQVLDLVCPIAGAVLHGRAATVRFLPRREDRRDPAVNDFAPMVTRAAEGAPAAAVLVIACGSYRDTAVAGGKKLTLVDSLGFGGLITDGRLRDFDEAREIGMPAYCTGETIRADAGELAAADHGLPVELAGAVVYPNDWVYADRAGAVVVPGDLVDDVVAAAIERERADADESRRIREHYRREP